MSLSDPTCPLGTAGHTGHVGVAPGSHLPQAGFGFHSLVCDLSGPEINSVDLYLNSPVDSAIFQDWMNAVCAPPEEGHQRQEDLSREVIISYLSYLVWWTEHLEVTGE